MWRGWSRETGVVKEIEKKERELGYFKKLHGQRLLENYREKKDLQESIQTKEKELQEAKAKLKENEKKLEKYKEKVRSLKKRIEEGVRELGIRDGSIIQLEKEKAKVVADLESERMKVRVHKTYSNSPYIDLIVGERSEPF